MSSGLTRRRGGGGGGPAAEGENSNGLPRNNSSSNFKDSAPETSYESSENGHKIAYDPRDISESAERSKQPKLTLMEEVLLLGLKDKQVRRPLALLPDLLLRSCCSASGTYIMISIDVLRLSGLSFFLERQHILCTPRLHCHRTGLPWPHQHAEGPLETPLPLARSRH